MIERGQRRARLTAIEGLPDMAADATHIRVGGESYTNLYSCTDLATGRPCGVWHVRDIERYWPTVEGLDVWDPEEGAWVPSATPTAPAPPTEWVNPILSDDDPFG